MDDVCEVSGAVLRADHWNRLLEQQGNRRLTDIYREEHFVVWFARVRGVRWQDACPGLMLEMVMGLYEPAFDAHVALFADDQRSPWGEVWDACGCEAAVTS